MYSLSSWRSYLGIVTVDLLHQEPTRTVEDPFDLLHQEPTRTVGDPFTVHVPGKVTRVSRITNVLPKFLEKSPR